VYLLGATECAQCARPDFKPLVTDPSYFRSACKRMKRRKKEWNGICLHWCACAALGRLCDTIEVLAPSELHTGASARRHAAHAGIRKGQIQVLTARSATLFVDTTY